MVNAALPDASWLAPSTQNMPLVPFTTRLMMCSFPSFAPFSHLPYTLPVFAPFSLSPIPSPPPPVSSPLSPLWFSSRCCLSSSSPYPTLVSLILLSSYFLVMIIRGLTYLIRLTFTSFNAFPHQIRRLRPCTPHRFPPPQHSIAFWH